MSTSNTRRMAYDGEGIEKGYLTVAEAEARFASVEIDEETNTLTVDGRIYYEIEQHTGHQYESVNNSESATLDEARADMAELESAQGWRDLRIVKMRELDNVVSTVDVIEYGTASDDEEDEA